MKRFVSILCAAALLTSLTGCKDGKISDIPSDSENSSVAADSTGNSDSEGANTSDNSDNPDSAPEKKKPEGEPTFLIGLDGEPVYTGDISRIEVYNAELEQVTADVFDRENIARVECEGFTYAYIPRPGVNFMERPELFEKSDSHYGIVYDYIGEELPDSYEFMRINVGDKIGSLTVKAAKAVFEPIDYDSMNEIGEFYENGYVEYDGEVELTGYVIVTEETPLYPGSGGNTFFYPDAESSVKIPQVTFDRNFDNEFKARHYVVSNFYGWYGDYTCLSLGSVENVSGELHEGDRYVKVKVTLGDIVLGYVRVNAAVKDIDLI